MRPNGTRTEYAYNVRNHVTTDRSARLAALVHKAAAGALLLGLSYGVDATGLRDSIADFLRVLRDVTRFVDVACAGQRGLPITPKIRRALSQYGWEF